jgi:hypothetical protein
MDVAWTGSQTMSQFVLSSPQLPPRESLAPRLGENVHLQNQSALFNAIPAEVRNRIFSIALTAYDDKSKPYQPRNWFYRPDWHFHRKISTTLLRTCKRVYLECYLLPLALNSHTFWAGAGRGPPSRYFASAYQTPPLSSHDNVLGNWNTSGNFRGFFNNLTAEQRGAVGELHFFLQHCYLEIVRFSPPLDPDSCRPIATKRLKITIRHQDWYWWERNEKLGLCPWKRGRTEWNQMDTPMPRTRMEWLSSQGWGAQLQYIQGLEELELELETLVGKREQMDGIVERAKKWIFPLKENQFLRWDDGTGVKESRWEEDDDELHGDVPSPDEAIASSADGTLPLSAEDVALPGVPRSAQGNARDETTSQSSVVAQANGQACSTSGQTPFPVAKRQYYVVSMVWKTRAN